MEVSRLIWWHGCLPSREPGSGRPVETAIRELTDILWGQGQPLVDASPHVSGRCNMASALSAIVMLLPGGPAYAQDWIAFSFGALGVGAKSKRIILCRSQRSRMRLVLCVGQSKANANFFEISCQFGAVRRQMLVDPENIWPASQTFRPGPCLLKYGAKRLRLAKGRECQPANGQPGGGDAIEQQWRQTIFFRIRKFDRIPD